MFLCFLLLLVACKSGNTPEPTPTPEDPDKGLTIVALDQHITHVQPMTGLVLWTTHSSHEKYKDVISLEYSYCLPCRVVTGKKDGVVQYDWTYFEDILNDISSRGHQAVVRFRYEYPGNREVDGIAGSTAVPQYIKDLPDYNETKFTNDDGQTYYADWSNQELQWFTKQFYTDFAARYNNDARIAFMEVGFGHWSEYHIYGTGLKLGTNFPTKEYQTEFLKHVDNVFTLPWAISIDASSTYYTPIIKSSELMALGFGLFDDSFMHKDHEGDYNEECWDEIGQGTRWQKGVCGGEISYYKSSDQKNFLNPDGMYGHTWEEQAAKYHITFMISNDAPGSKYATVERFKEAALASGYKFQVTKCATSDSLTAVYITNSGVAPIYYDAYVTIKNQRAEQSLINLLPGETWRLTFPFKLNNAADLHIECDHLLNGQSIEFETTK